MRILIYGAGVIGSLYAALLADAGYDTSIYARGKRLEILKNNGLLYKKNQDLIKAKIKIIEEVPNDDIYDFILLTVRENQLYEALTELKNNKSNTIVTMVNSLDSYKKWEDIVGTGRILPAFPGAGGSINDDGILDASLTPRITMYLCEKDIRKIFSIIERSFQKVNVMVETMSPFVVKHVKEKSIENSNAKFTWGVKNGTELQKIVPNFSILHEVSLVEGMKELMPVYCVIGKIPAVRNISNKIIVLKKRG